MSMTATNSALRSRDRAGECVRADAELAALIKLQGRAQFVRLGNHCQLAELGSGFVYIVAKGVIGIECSVVSGVRVITALLYPGDVVVPKLQAPLPGLVLTSQRPAEFWKIATTAFVEETSRDDQLWQTIFLRLNAQNARQQMHTAAMSALNSEERVAAFLVESGTRLGFPSGRSISFELPLSRYGIADYLSLNADTVSRTFSALAAAKIIERRGRFQISVRDWSALEAKCPLSEAIIKLHAAGKPSLTR
ncbi:Crp/Fnr family transcriptional regulator [Hyphomicrobium sp.]|uniref:Crp/Fnr family transcriptional regulator n=1 Tax=Hyphomicrobium sp. TaxID=82 RepID=UPI0025C463FC|nr:Crp/Fnr family transcriptional regulator [Hyphomicrobium sp.]